jgi:hypothetical protein
MWLRPRAKILSSGITKKLYATPFCGSYPANPLPINGLGAIVMRWIIMRLAEPKSIK